MRTSRTIAALLGPTLIASALSIFINLRAWPTLVEQAFRNPALIFISGYPLFVAGLAILYSHNRWTRGWPVLVTALGWLAALAGLARILFPTRLAGIAMGAVDTSGVMPAAAIIILLLGGFLSVMAYRQE